MKVDKSVFTDMLKNIDKNIKAQEDKKNVQSDPSTFVQDSELFNGFFEGYNDEESDKKEEKSVLVSSNFIIFSILIVLCALLFYNVLSYLILYVWINRMWIFQVHFSILFILLTNGKMNSVLYISNPNSNIWTID